MLLGLPLSEDLIESMGFPEKRAFADITHFRGFGAPFWPRDQSVIPPDYLRVPQGVLRGRPFYSAVPKLPGAGDRCLCENLRSDGLRRG